MEDMTITTSFGRRPMTYAQLQSQRRTQTQLNNTTRPAGKWESFRTLRAVAHTIGLKDRSLTVLNALLSFYPGSELKAGANLVVFPSNKSLSERANAMSPATLRRHICALVDAGIIIRRDSPNGKRYARRNRNGELNCAYGFDLSPLLVRQQEFQRLAEAEADRRQAYLSARERVTIARRTASKLLSLATQSDHDQQQTVAALVEEKNTLMEQMSKGANIDQLNALAAAIEAFTLKITKFLESIEEPEETSATDSQIERHIEDQTTELKTEDSQDTSQAMLGNKIAKLVQSSSGLKELLTALNPARMRDLDDIACAVCVQIGIDARRAAVLNRQHGTLKLFMAIAHAMDNTGAANRAATVNSLLARRTHYFSGHEPKVQLPLNKNETVGAADLKISSRLMAWSRKV